jgi:hypothetical protein
MSESRSKAFLVALVAFWGDWRIVGFAALLPILGTFQVLLIGDTDKQGGWVNGLHGMFALVVLLIAPAKPTRRPRAGRRTWPSGGEDDNKLEAKVFCPECAARDFGDVAS